MLDVRGLSMHYPNGNVALRDVTLSVAPGEFVVVLGGNGSGKTTLLRCITRMLTPSSGSITLSGTDITRLSGESLRRVRLALAMIWQQSSLVRRRDVRSNVACGALGRYNTLWSTFGGLPRQELEAAAGYLAEVGLANLANQRAATLSGGQSQRVAIARALAQHPKVLLADEPIASLDPEAADDIMRLLRRLATEEDLAVLCVLHQVDLAYRYADRIVGIRRGVLVFDRARGDTPRELVQQLYVDEAA